MKYADLKEGMKIRAMGISCIEDKVQKVAWSGTYDEWYVRCSNGRHYLSGQVDNDSDELIGVEEVKS